MAKEPAGKRAHQLLARLEKARCDEKDAKKAQPDRRF
jgi:hypothetical protein